MSITSRAAWRLDVISALGIVDGGRLKGGWGLRWWLLIEGNCDEDPAVTLDWGP